MKAIIRLDVPEFQIGQSVNVYFKDTMMKTGVCEKEELVRCKDCKHARRMCQPWNDLVCEKNGQTNRPQTAKKPSFPSLRCLRK